MKFPAHVVGAYRRSGVIFRHAHTMPDPLIPFCGITCPSPLHHRLSVLVISELVLLLAVLLGSWTLLTSLLRVAIGPFTFFLLSSCATRMNTMCVAHSRRVTHLLTELEYADYVYVMRRGQILGHGPPADVGPYLAAAGLVHPP